jgi:dihydrofolate reductase
MRKVIAAINMTLDGSCDHTVGIPDEDIHRHYQELLNEGDVVLYGRVTYQLMEFWRTFIESPSKEKSMNDFALAIDKIQKIVFSSTLDNLEWKSAKLAENDLVKTVLELKQKAGKNIFIGSRSLIIQLLDLNLIDELQICVHPIISKNTLPLFENISNGQELKLITTNLSNSGDVQVLNIISLMIF